MKNQESMHHNIKFKIIKNKSDLVLETILLYNVDLTILMETRLKDTDEDQAWVKTGELANKDFRMETINRPDKQRGRVAILYSPKYHIMRVENSQQYTTLEVGAWVTTVRNTPITTLGIYLPLLGLSLGNSNATLIEDVN